MQIRLEVHDFSGVRYDSHMRSLLSDPLSQFIRRRVVVTVNGSKAEAAMVPVVDEWVYDLVGDVWYAVVSVV